MPSTDWAFPSSQQMDLALLASCQATEWVITLLVAPGMEKESPGIIFSEMLSSNLLQELLWDQLGRGAFFYQALQPALLMC